MPDYDIIEFDIVIIGAGPAGLSAAIELKKRKPELKVCILEKGAEVGAHILSGAVLEPRALNELIPDWKEKGAPLHTEAKKDHFKLLTKSKAYTLPTPPQMKNHGNYIISLGNFCRWLGEQASQAGVEIFPGFAAKEALIENGRVTGVLTGEIGRTEKGETTDNYQAPMAIKGKYTLFGEGCRGHISEQLIQEFNLRKDKPPQTYAIGIKELWEVKPENHQPGKIEHSIGWPLDSKTYGGSFIYHLENNQVSFGFVIGLDYQNPYLSPYDEMQRFKTHPAIAPLFEGGKRISYGARALNEGGVQSIPTLHIAGGAFIGCSAGFLNVPKIKGTHTAMKSGMLAAEAIIEQLEQGTTDGSLENFETKVKGSWIYSELNKVRNIRPAFHFGLFAGLAYSAIDTYLLRGNAPWTFSHKPDHEQLRKASECTPITYPKADNILTFDKLASVALSGTNHEEDQPKHLIPKDKAMPIEINLKEYAGPESRYCPAGVYEYLQNEKGEDYLQINAQNCVHCKTCDIKDPCQNIKWTTPEGSGGPRYPNM